MPSTLGLGFGIVRLHAIQAAAPPPPPPDTFTVYFGENTDPGGEVVGNPLTQRQAWNTAAGTYLTEDFESFSIPTPPDYIAFPASITFVNGPQSVNATTALVTGGGDDSGCVVGKYPYEGRFPTSGNQYLDLDWSYTIDFGTNYIKSFGFYITDIGDKGGALSIELTRSNNTVDTPIAINTTATGSGGLAFWGFISTRSYKKIKIINSKADEPLAIDRDPCGFDDMVIQLV